MAQAYIGIINRFGLESFVPEREHGLRFLARRIGRNAPGEALSYWAVVNRATAERIRWELTIGRHLDALVILQTHALDFGTVLPFETQSVTEGEFAA